MNKISIHLQLGGVAFKVKVAEFEAPDKHHWVSTGVRVEDLLLFNRNCEIIVTTEYDEEFELRKANANRGFVTPD